MQGPLGPEGRAGHDGDPGSEVRSYLLRTFVHAHFTSVSLLFLFIAEKGPPGERGPPGVDGPVGLPVSIDSDYWTCTDWSLLYAYIH